MRHFAKEAERLDNLISVELTRSVIAMRFVIEQALSKPLKEIELVELERALQNEIHIAITEKLSSLRVDERSSVFYRETAYNETK